MIDGNKLENCVWSIGMFGEYNTACDHSFSLDDGTPGDNGMAYCCYCGKPLTSVDEYSDD